MMSDLAFAGLVRQAQLVRDREVSSRELVELSLQRIERFEPELNAFGAVYAEQALKEAENPRPGPLSGVPIAVKDEMDIAGEITSRGTGVFTERAAQDSDVVARLRDAGAIVIGKTKMPELGLWPFTESITWGVTRNPWDTDRTPGGSSGGSAAAVAAGIVPAAVAADGAGSIRIPAACCGLFGLKPQIGRVPRAPHYGDNHWICFGGLTRSVEDAALMYDVLAPDIGREAPRPLKIAYSEAFPPLTTGKLDDDTRTALRDTASLLRDLGHTVTERDHDLRARDMPVLVSLLMRGIRELMVEIERPQRLERRTRAMGRPGALVNERLVEKLLEAEKRHRRPGRPAVGRVRRAADADDVPAGTTGAGDGGPRRRSPRGSGRAAGSRSACSSTRPDSLPRRFPRGSRSTGCRWPSSSSAGTAPRRRCSRSRRR